MKKLQAADEEIIEAGDSDDDDDDGGDDMQLLSSMLDDEPKKRQRGKTDAPVLKEAYAEGEFNISTGDAKVGAVTVNRLMDALQGDTSAGMSRVKKKLDKFTAASNQTVGLEKPKHLREQEERKATTKGTSAEMDSWRPVLEEIEDMDEIKFPLHVAPSITAGQSVSRMVDDHKGDREGETSLERRVRESLEEAGIETRQDVDSEEEMMNIIALDEEGQDLLGAEATQERRKQLAKLRSVVGYKQEKLARMKKIKSKTYRKILRKMKVTKEEKALARLEEIDPQAAILKRREKMEKDRAMERATLKHKNSAATSRRKRNLMKWNKQAREDAHNASSIAEKLTQRWSEKMDADLEEESEESSDEEVEAQQDHMDATETKKLTTASSIIQALRTEVNDSCPSNLRTGVAALPFMKRAYQKQREELLQEIDAMEKTAELGKTDPAMLQKALMETERQQKTPKPTTGDDSETSGSEHDEYGFLTTKAIRKREVKRNQEAQKELAQLKADDKKAGQPNQSNQPPKPGAPAEDAQKDRSNMTKAEKKREREKQRKLNKKRKADELQEKVKEEKEVLAAKKSDYVHAKAAPPSKRQKQETAEPTEEIEEDEEIDEDEEGMVQEGEEEEEDEDEITEEEGDDAEDPNKIEMSEEEDDENLDGDDDDDDEHAELMDSQDYLVSRAFAADNVDDDFMREKDAIIAKDATPIDPALALPGWGEWGGEDPELNVKQKKKLEDLKTKQKEEIDVLKANRLDNGLDNVIINENVNVIPEQFQITRLPVVFKTEEEFSNAMRHPLAPELNTELSNKTRLAPAVRTRKGRNIAPLTKDALPPKPAHKTKLRKADALKISKGQSVG